MAKSKKGKSKVNRVKTPNCRGLLIAVEGAAVKGYDMGKQVGDFQMVNNCEIMIVIGFIVLSGALLELS